MNKVENVEGNNGITFSILNFFHQSKNLNEHNFY